MSVSSSSNSLCCSSGDRGEGWEFVGGGDDDDVVWAFCWWPVNKIYKDLFGYS